MPDLKDLIIQHEATEQAEGDRLEAILARISAEVTKHAEQKRKPPQAPRQLDGLSEDQGRGIRRPSG